MPVTTDASSGTLIPLALAMVLFVGSHLLLSAPTLRAPLVTRLSERGFQALYSVISLVLIYWVARAYAAAPVVDLWQPPVALRHLSLTLMPLAFIAVIAGITTRNPAALGAAPEAQEPVGITRITRHPVMCGVALWGVLHLLANGDAAAIILFGGITLLALLGARAQERKKRRQLGRAWDGFAAQTSYVPFAAMIAGRTRLRWSEIGAWRIGLGLILYGIFLVWLHPWLFGVSPLPF